MEINTTLWAAFLAGMLSFFSPCMIPLLPVYTSQISTAILENKGHYRSGCGISLQVFIFIIGFILVFVGLGTTSGFLGKFLNINQTMILKAGGIFVTLMGLNLLGLLKINLPTRQKTTRRNGRKKNYITSFFSGHISGPCVDPLCGSDIGLCSDPVSYNQFFHRGKYIINKLCTRNGHTPAGSVSDV